MENQQQPTSQLDHHSHLLLLDVRHKNNNILKIKYLNKNFNFSIKNELLPYQQNILATISALSLKYDLNKINKFIFNSYKIPEGRGNSFKLKIKNKYITVFD